MMASKKVGPAVVEKAEAVLGKSEYGNDQPMLRVATRTTDVACALRHNRAIGLRAAAEVELALGEANDTGWLVDAPAWGDEQRLPLGWRTTFMIQLEGSRGAKPEVAMKALDKVAEALRAG